MCSLLNWNQRRSIEPVVIECIDGKIRTTWDDFAAYRNGKGYKFTIMYEGKRP